MNKEAIDSRQAQQFEKKILDLVKNRNYLNFAGSHAAAGAGVGGLGGGVLGLADTAGEQMRGELEGKDKVKAYLNKALRYGTIGGALGGTVGGAKGTNIAKGLKGKQLSEVKSLLAQGAAPDLLLKNLIDKGHLKDVHVMDYLKQHGGGLGNDLVGSGASALGAHGAGDVASPLGAATDMMHPVEEMLNKATPGLGSAAPGNTRYRKSGLNPFVNDKPRDARAGAEAKFKPSGKVSAPERVKSEHTGFDAPSYTRAENAAAGTTAPAAAADSVMDEAMTEVGKMEQKARAEVASHIANVGHDFSNAPTHLTNAAKAQKSADAWARVRHHSDKYLKATNAGDDVNAAFHHAELTKAISNVPKDGMPAGLGAMPVTGGPSSAYTGGATTTLPAVGGVDYKAMASAAKGARA